MRNLALSAMLLGLMSLPAFAADPIAGMWKTQPDDGSYAYVKIGPCGANFCGVIARTFRASGEYKSPNIGKEIVIDMVPEGGGRYHGKVWRPSNDKIYVGKISLKGDQMALSGCILGGLFCKAQDWTRVR
ncbi:imidazoleglycerol-phosphate dehydratase [Defluviimonas sp. 20V17]|uniref:Uncharacterized conserved protein, DUF2147 family n=1 Tax=Allgaiera indica TaxID=765699 RepID=A0AAN4URX4_9RHOB|nr:DUF2147 domain-containing protein [Allgaiera indica]KDB02380.1 imidazoleglycerol-phosphate dehydratase [Defluviimonas sp. 20V17]GHE02265.1 hypothetical protein GCM10008024_21190 [Allgaiera indica]SDX07576.1 Uncharacterized conserved protein, DUF2147 family [Allgaiera indica]